MSLKEQLSNDLKDALRAGDELRKSTIRMASAAVHNAEIASGHALDDAGVLDVLRKQVKQRQDSVDEFGKAGRADLVAKESAEMEVLRGYLPQTLGRDQVEAAAREVIAEVGAAGPRDKGRVMGPLLKRLAGQADGREVNEVVTSLLAGG